MGVQMKSNLSCFWCSAGCEISWHRKLYLAGFNFQLVVVNQISVQNFGVRCGDNFLKGKLNDTKCIINAEKDTHNKGRQLDQAVIFIKCEMRTSLKGKNLLPEVANSFLYE